MKIGWATCWILVQVILLCGCGEKGEVKSEERTSAEVAPTSSVPNEAEKAIAEIEKDFALSLPYAATNWSGCAAVAHGTAEKIQKLPPALREPYGRKMAQAMGREPTEEELALELGVHAQDVRKLRAMATRPVSLQKPVGDEDDACIADFLADTSSADPSKATEQNLMREELSAVLDTLGTRERQVLDYRYGLTDGNCRTLEEVGRLFNVTRERVRQIEAKALRMLRHPSRMRRLRDIQPRSA